MRPAKIVAIVIGVLLILISLAFLGSGSFLTWLGSHTDSNGFLSFTDNHLSSSGYALTSPNVELKIGSSDWIPGGGFVEIRATSTGTAPIFVGIGPTDQVAGYLNGVAYDEVTNLGWFRSSVDLVHHEGGAPASAPGQQDFWAAKQEGTGTQSVEWAVQSGNWTAVLMNADGSAPVSANLRLGARLGFLLPLGIGLLVAGVVLLAVGILLVVLGARRPRRQAQPVYPGGPGYGPPHGQPPASPQTPYGPGQQQYAPPPYQHPLYQQPPHQPPAGPPPVWEPPKQAPPMETPPGQAPEPPSTPAAPDEPSEAGPTVT